MCSFLARLLDHQGFYFFANLCFSPQSFPLSLDVLAFSFSSHGLENLLVLSFYTRSSFLSLAVLTISSLLFSVHNTLSVCLKNTFLCLCVILYTIFLSFISCSYNFFIAFFCPQYSKCLSKKHISVASMSKVNHLFKMRDNRMVSPG